MSIEEGQQVLPTEGFDDFADETKEESDALEDQINAEQELNDNNTAQLEADDPDDTGEVETGDDSGAKAEGDDDDDNSGTAADDKSASQEEIAEGSEEGSEETDEEAKAKADAEEADAVEATAAKEAKEAKEALDKEELSKKEKFERYSRGVQRKINKEVKKRGVLETENQELRARLDNIENKMSKESRDSEVAVLANRLRNATAIKKQLMEDGEYEQVATVDNDIIKMRIAQSKLEDAQSNDADDADNTGRNVNNAQNNDDYDQGSAQPAYVPDLQTKWIQSNDRFGKDVAYTNYVNNTYDTLLEEGYDPESSSMYAELNTRTGTTADKADASNEADNAADNVADNAADNAAEKAVPNKPVKSRPQSAPTPNVTQAQRSAAASRGITEADKINMRNWGLDPNSKAVRQEWLANKRGKK